MPILPISLSGYSESYEFPSASEEILGNMGK